MTVIIAQVAWAQEGDETFMARGEKEVANMFTSPNE
jgi:hypothetical protein